MSAARSRPNPFGSGGFSAEPLGPRAIGGMDLQLNDEPMLLTIPEAAEQLRIGRTLIYELISAGELEVVHIGRASRVPLEALRDFVAARADPGGRQ